MEHKIVEKIIALIFTALAVIVILQLVLKLTGHSPTQLQMLYGTVGILVAFMMGAGMKLGIFIGRSGHFMDLAEKKFEKVEKDIELMKRNINVLKIDVTSLKTDVNLLKIDVTSLKTDVSSLKIDVASLKTDVTSLKIDIKEIKKYILTSKG